MSDETEHDFHVRRARAELDLAYRSECRAAMESHLRLSSLHMQRLGSGELAARPARLQSSVRTRGADFSIGPRQGNNGAREGEAVSG
jgi:hypothetical protein